MSNTYNDASMIVKDATYLDAVIRGLLTEPSQSVDQLVDDSLWNKLFRFFKNYVYLIAIIQLILTQSYRPVNKTFGFDVVALNIQRGRDHGLPSYNTYRQLCGFSKLTSFADLNSTTNPTIPSTVID